METTITKKDAEFIKHSAIETYGDVINRTYHLPVFYKMTEVMIDCNVITGKHQGEWIEYYPQFTDEAKEILDIL